MLVARAVLGGGRAWRGGGARDMRRRTEIVMKSTKKRKIGPSLTAHRRISKKQLLQACERVVELAQQYKPTEHHREMGYDGLLFGFLEASFGKIRRQHQIWMGKSRVPKRIDYRQGGTSPVVIEFAVRTPGRNEIYGSQNRDEIRKLARQRKASGRYLVLLDLSRKPALVPADLWVTYKGVNAGPGRFTRKPVQVIYVHPALTETFLWRP